LGQLFRRPETVPPVTFGTWCTDYPDPQDWLSVLFRSADRDTGSAFNTGFSDPAFDRLVDQADGERDETRRADLYQKAARMLSDRAVVAFLYTQQTFRLRKPRVRGIVDSPLDIEVASMTGTFDKIFIAKKGR
jgi:ABC-type oligopeptide transport system substrate-binding subunit